MNDDTAHMLSGTGSKKMLSSVSSAGTQGHAGTAATESVVKTSSTGGNQHCST